MNTYKRTSFRVIVIKLAVYTYLHSRLRKMVPVSMLKVLCYCQSIEELTLYVHTKSMNKLQEQTRKECNLLLLLRILYIVTILQVLIKKKEKTR